MIHAKNYETVSILVKVRQRKLWVWSVFLVTLQSFLSPPHYS